MTIDAHHHLWDPAERPYPWMDESVGPLRRRFDEDDLRAAVAGTGVDRTVVVQAAHDLGETRWLLGRAAPVAGVVGWVDLTAPDVADTLDELLEVPRGVPLVGVRHQAQDEPDPGWLARADVVRGVRAVVAAGLTFDLLVREREHAAALALADAVPDGQFVLDHAGKPDIASDDGRLRSGSVLRAWSDRLARTALRPNVTCKLSGLFTEAGPDWSTRPVERYAHRVLEEFGADRSMFGSDWPVSTTATSYADVVRRSTGMLTELSDDERAAVTATTAARVYGIGAAPGSALDRT